jgi:hypothetical protein
VPVSILRALASRIHGAGCGSLPPHELQTGGKPSVLIDPARLRAQKSAYVLLEFRRPMRQTRSCFRRRWFVPSLPPTCGDTSQPPQARQPAVAWVTCGFMHGKQPQLQPQSGPFQCFSAGIGGAEEHPPTSSIGVASERRGPNNRGAPLCFCKWGSAPRLRPVSIPEADLHHRRVAWSEQVGICYCKPEDERCGHAA